MRVTVSRHTVRIEPAHCQNCDQIARELRCSEQTFFFLCVGVGRRLRQSGPRPPRSSRACRAVLPGRRLNGIGPTRQPRPPRCSRWRRAVQVRCRCATRPRRSALVDSGACSIRSGARMQLGMRKGDHDMVHGLACMRGCSLVVQRVERGANFKNRV